MQRCFISLTARSRSSGCQVPAVGVEKPEGWFSRWLKKKYITPVKARLGTHFSSADSSDSLSKLNYPSCLCAYLIKCEEKMDLDKVAFRLSRWGDIWCVAAAIFQSDNVQGFSVDCVRHCQLHLHLPLRSPHTPHITKLLSNNPSQAHYSNSNWSSLDQIQDHLAAL